MSVWMSFLKHNITKRNTEILMLLLYVPSNPKVCLAFIITIELIALHCSF